MNFYTKLVLGYLLTGYLISLLAALTAPPGDDASFAPKGVLIVMLAWGGYALWHVWRICCFPIVLARVIGLRVLGKQKEQNG